MLVKGFLNMSELPNFMSEQSKTNYENEVERKNSWLANNVFKMMAWFSACWFAVILIYITQFFGWSNLFLMMPDEFGGFLAGVTLPLAIIWVIMAYIDRGTNFKNEAKFLRAYMNQLVYPEEGGANTAKAMADAIRSQVVELQEVTKHANLQTLNIKNELENKIEEFSKLVSILDNYSGKTMIEFSNTMQNMIKNFDYVSTQANDSTNNFKGHVIELSTTTQEISHNISELFSSLLPRINELKASSAIILNINNDNSAKLAANNKFLVDFANVAQNITQASEEIHQKLEGSVNKLSNTLFSQTKMVEEYVENLDTATDALSKKMSNQGELVAQEVEKVVTRSQFVAENIENQVMNLNGVAENVINDMENIANSIQNTNNVLENNALNAIGSINQVIETIDLGADKIANNTENSLENITKLNNQVESKVQNWQNIYNHTITNFANISLEIDDKTKQLHSSSQNIVEDIKEVGATMDKYSNNLTETCSIVVAQNKMSESSLAQQQKHLNISINSLEEARKEIKNQIEELARAAVVINDEALVAVNHLKNQMNDTLQTSEDVVTKTRVINDTLAQQSNIFENSTTQTLAKISGWNEQMKEHYVKLDKVSNDVQDRSEKITHTIEKQLKLVDSTTSEAEKKYTNIMESFEQQTTMLNSVSEGTISYVAEVVQALDEKAEAINVLFRHQENTFFDICDKLSENNSNINNSLKKHITTIEQSADRVFSRMTVLEEDVQKRAEIVTQTSTATIDKISDVQKMIEINSQEAFAKINEMNISFTNTSEGIKEQVATFKNTVEEIGTQTSQSSDLILKNCTKIKDTNFELTTESKNVANLIGANATSLDAFLVKTRAQAEGIKETFEAQKEALTDVVNVVATQTRLGESALAQQYKILSDASIEVAQKMNEIQLKFKNNTDSITDVSGKIAYEIDSLGDRLIKISEDVEKSSKASIKNVEQVNMTLAQCETDLSSVVNNSVTKVGSVVNDYEKYIANFNTVTAEASSGVFEINNLILDQSDKMIKISEDTKELVTCFNTVLNDTSLELSNRANFAFEKVKGLGENLKTLSMQLEESGKLGAHHMENSGDKLRATMTEISANAERISNSILNSGETFLKQSDVLVVTTDDTLVKVKNVMNALNDSAQTFSSTSDEALQKTANFSDLVGVQVKTLLETSTKTDAKLKELITNYDNVKMDSFLKDASYIIEALETSAVDINRLFNPEAVEELWKKYYNGDNSVFVRHLAKNLSKQQIAEIRKLFEQNNDFRKMVTKYLSDFESLLAKAQQNEKAGILLSVITGADIGRVYYVLARALDKLN